MTQKEGFITRKKELIAACALSCLALTACQSNRSIPQLLSAADKEPIVLAAFAPAEVVQANQKDEEAIVAVTKTKFPFKVPKNYKNISGYVFAVLNKQQEITGYRVAQKKNGKWVWQKCDASGNIKKKKKVVNEEKKKEQTTSSATTSIPTVTPKPSTPPTTETSSATAKKNTTSSPKKTTKKKTTTTTKKKKATSTTKKKETAKKEPTKNTSSVTTPWVFSWSSISIAQCPSNVQNAFSAKISNAQEATASMSSGQYTYALIKAPNGCGVTVSSVYENGIIAYSIVDTGAQYTIVRLNKNVGINFSKR